MEKKPTPRQKKSPHDQWARDKLAWVITNCVRSLAAELRRNAAEIEKRSK